MLVFVSKRRRLCGSRELLAASAITAFMAISGLSASAEAAIPPALREGTRAWFASFSIGPAIKVDDVPSQFKMIQEVGYHFWGGAEGPAFGGAISQSFGDSGNVDYFTFSLGPKFWWDFALVSGLGLYLSPFAELGYALVNASFRGNDTTNHFLHMQYGIEGKLVINNRGLVFFRPFSMDFFIGEFFGVRYDMMFGGGVMF